MNEELEDMETIYEILKKYNQPAQQRILEWVAKYTDYENSKRQQGLRDARLNQILCGDEMLKEKAPNT